MRVSLPQLASAWRGARVNASDPWTPHAFSHIVEPFQVKSKKKLWFMYRNQIQHAFQMPRPYPKTSAECYVQQRHKARKIPLGVSVAWSSTIVQQEPERSKVANAAHMSKSIFPSSHFISISLPHFLSVLVFILDSYSYAAIDVSKHTLEERQDAT